MRFCQLSSLPLKFAAKLLGGHLSFFFGGWTLDSYCFCKIMSSLGKSPLLRPSINMPV
jgi:hypothetical protein